MMIEHTWLVTTEAQFIAIFEENLRQNEINKDNTGSIYNHNEDWDTNKNRCPMYLTQISDVDDRWPDDGDDTEWREFFHRLLVYSEIRKFINKHGMDKYNELWEVFPSVKNHGYDLKEAMEADLAIINIE